MADVAIWRRLRIRESRSSYSTDDTALIQVHHRKRHNQMILFPKITHTPQAPGLIYGGQTVNLLSQAEGKYLSYQWYKNGHPIAGATGDRYVIEDIPNKTQHDGNYSLVVSNDFGTVTTPTTTIDVNGTPTTHTVPSPIVWK